MSLRQFNEQRIRCFIEFQCHHLRMQVFRVLLKTALGQSSLHPEYQTLTYHSAGNDAAQSTCFSHRLVDGMPIEKKAPRYKRGAFNFFIHAANYATFSSSTSSNSASTTSSSSSAWSACDAGPLLSSSAAAFSYIVWPTFISAADKT